MSIKKRQQKWINRQQQTTSRKQHAYIHFGNVVLSFNIQVLDAGPIYTQHYIN